MKLYCFIDYVNYLYESKYFILFHFIDISKGLCTVVSVSVFTALEMLYLGVGDVAGLGQGNSPRKSRGKVPVVSDH